MNTTEAVAAPAGPGSLACPTTARELALALLQPFSERILPGVVRRLSHWRGYGIGQRLDLLEEVRQDLAVDCLQHASLVSRLGEPDRHARWFRIMERRIRREPTVPIGAIERGGLHARSEQHDMPLLEGLDLRLLDADRIIRLRNGRCNVELTADRLGMRPEQIREAWERLADRVGFDHVFLSFWRQRLTEALVGLAADLLRDDNAVRTLEAARRPPDPELRLRRLRRIHATVRVRPLPNDLRCALGPVLRRRPGRRSALAVVEAAAKLDPDNPTVLLWQFEARVAAGRLGGAMAAIRRARLHGADAVRVVLARARICEARGHLDRARRLLARHLRRRPHDRRLRHACGALD
jgi:hypothetical protein